MEKSSFFPNRSLRWSFWTNILFLLGMIGYSLMDGFDYVHPNTLSSSLSSSIYVILASLFVIDSNLQILSVYHINRNTHRYYAMVFSCLFDEIGSHAYFLGALFAATSLTNSTVVLICNRIGVLGFAIGAAINMIVPGSTILYSWANSLNLSASLSYVLAIFITNVTATQIIVILADCVYVIDATLYIICWFYDRRFALEHSEQILLVTK